MRPSARIAALIELLTEVEEGIATGGTPADVLVNQYFRARRYAGSKDRRAITEMLYAILRERELLLWATGDRACARNLALAHFVFHDPEALVLLEEAGPFSAEPLTELERTLISELKEIDLSAAPSNVQHNIPEWAATEFSQRFGDLLSDGAEALNREAPVDLRPNTLKVEMDFLNQFIKNTEVFEKTKLSPFAVRSEKNIGLGGIKEYKSGKLEVQDEAAQVASLLVGAKPGMQVADMCAGAGGKALLVSSQMSNKGQLYAFDNSGKRLAECKKRIERSGSRNIQVTQLATEGSVRSAKLAGMSKKCDRVYVDVPCSGTGTWRRSPDQRWRLDAAKLNDLTEIQYNLLSEAAGLVKQDGRLLYMTCSVLPLENEVVVQRFLKEEAGAWLLCDYRETWAETVGTDCPETCSTIPETLQLVPHVHETDGFFVAIFERASTS
tara:strand:+ start:572 stop:1891 length:1320 start_codon:yes stop_codon:yes gene_type:complete